jgi:serine/threonine protein kinase
MVNLLGEGTFKVVALAIDSSTLEKVAIAKIREPLTSERACKLALRELKMSRLLKHENILSCKSVMSIPDDDDNGSLIDPLYIVMDCMDDDLTKVMQGEDG